jgi:hypothetical protein
VTRTSLELRNLLRWAREYAVSWGLLSVIYSFTVTMILEPILERALRTELEPIPLWAATCALLLLPGALDSLPLPQVSFRLGRFQVLRPGIFGERLFSRLGGPLGPLYLRHELRRGSTWLMIVLTVLAAGLLPKGKQALWVLFAQLPMQRALYSVHSWRGLAAAHLGPKAGRPLLQALLLSQGFQVAFAWLAVGMAGFLPRDLWLALGPAALGAGLAGAAVALEGDSGRPWLVNFFSLAAGTLGGYLCLASPWGLLAIAYLCSNTKGLAERRLLSVEHLDEDRIVR